MRLLTDETAAVTLARAYDPFGVPFDTDGTPASPFAFTGEWLDPSGLLHLRARYYDPQQGRFLSEDPWQGDALLPMSYNAWLYAYANPSNLTDPSGKYPFWGPRQGRTWTYSCRCGWIDWGHVLDAARQTQHLLQTLQNPPIENISHGHLIIDTTSTDPFHYTPPILDSSRQVVIVKVPINTLEERNRIALGIFQDRKNRFEGLQAWFPDAVRALAENPPSSFTYEDLPSELIGFYEGLVTETYGHSEIVDQLLIEKVRSACEVPQDGLDLLRDWSAYVEGQSGPHKTSSEYWNSAGIRLEEWGEYLPMPCTDRLFCNSSNKGWPHEYNNLDPQPAKLGVWWPIDIDKRDWRERNP